MRSFELAVAQMRSLPPASQVEVMDYIHKLHAATRTERLEAIQKTGYTPGRRNNAFYYLWRCQGGST